MMNATECPVCGKKGSDLLKSWKQHKETDCFDDWERPSKCDCRKCKEGPHDTVGDDDVSDFFNKNISMLRGQIDSL